jgi:formate hydrogenlyase subunit 3/multisubunit Na+/H+ antiporter MnhD subunit
VLAESPARWLLLAGFAVKLGILPLHLWLPLAHPVAPVPASAILSGVIVKAGLIGWLRFVPALPDDPAVIGQGCSRWGW